MINSKINWELLTKNNNIIYLIKSIEYFYFPIISVQLLLIVYIKTIIKIENLLVNFVFIL